MTISDKIYKKIIFKKIRELITYSDMFSSEIIIDFYFINDILIIEHIPGYYMSENKIEYLKVKEDGSYVFSDFKDMDEYRTNFVNFSDLYRLCL